MTNEELIATIRNEIERLYDGEAPKHDQQCDFSDGYFTALSRIDEFLDTLESEKPVPKDLEEAAEEVNDGTETSFIGVNGSGKTSKVAQVKGELVFKTKGDEYIPVQAEGVLFDFGSLTEAFQRRTEKDISISALLGSDFLKGHDAKIDYRKKNITITV